MTLSSNYQDGTFHGGKWYCGCNLETNWRTSTTETILRCPKPREEQCKFFLTAADEAAARSEKSSDMPPAPRTPIRKQVLPPWQTPDSGVGFSAIGSFRRGYLESTDVSPTPTRFRPNATEDIASAVLKKLQEDGLVIKSSTEVAIHCLINDKIKMYEARLQNLVENREMALQKLEELERTGVAVPGM
ncbi:hypothetical protein DPV78_000267 [Talaromyces pinophilus]|nr:hypothetical protein DPV78_000267 [Talaromyces pinophilus]